MNARWYPALMSLPTEVYLPMSNVKDHPIDHCAVRTNQVPTSNRIWVSRPMKLLPQLPASQMLPDS